MFSVLDAAAVARGENVLAVWFSGSMGFGGWVVGMGHGVLWGGEGAGWGAAQHSIAHNPPCNDGRVENYSVPCALMLTLLFHVPRTFFTHFLWPNF